MYNYCLKYFNGADNNIIWLTNEKLYSEEEFQEIIKSCVKKTFEKYPKEHTDDADGFEMVLSDVDVKTFFLTIADMMVDAGFFSPAESASFTTYGENWKELKSNKNDIDIVKEGNELGYKLVQDAISKDWHWE
jgi:hypothetical protein